MNLCDLHTHVLPGVDDGAPDLDYALQMLRNAAVSDVSLLAVTPHCNGPCGANYLDAELKARFDRLRRAAADIPVELVLGAEVWVDENLPGLLEAGKIPTINGSRYLLTEFPWNTPGSGFAPMLGQILSLGYVPLVAHPERYAAVCRNPAMVGQWLDMGCHLQLTGGSILGQFGKTAQRTAAFFLKNDLVACVASDAHGVHGRSNFLMDVYDHLAVQYSPVYARILMTDIPLRICRNDEL